MSLPPKPLDRSAKYLQLYSPEVVDRVLDAYIGGMSLTKIGKQAELPSYTTILRWIESKPEFRERFEQARKLRAIHMEEQAMEVIDQMDSDDAKDRAAVARLKFDIYKWSTEVGDSARYGRKTTVEGNVDKPIAFTIVTNIPRTPNQQETNVLEKVVESEVVEDESKIRTEQNI